MKSLAKIAVVGFTGAVAFKLFVSILFPLIGFLFGLLALTLKFALIAAVIFFVYEMLRKRKSSDESDVEVGEVGDDDDDDDDIEDVEIEVEM